MATPPDPEIARRQVHQILSEHRYDALHRPPGLLDRLWSAIGQALGDFLRWLFGLLGPAAPGLRLVVLLIALAALVVIAVVTARQISFRGRASADSTAREAEPAAADLFVEADRLAGLGDFAAAVRALALAVARSLVETHGADLTASPLTVREIYRSSHDAERLRPLLLAFEESFYGHHGMTAERYRVVESVAATYRSRLEQAA